MVSRGRVGKEKQSLEMRMNTEPSEYGEPTRPAGQVQEPCSILKATLMGHQGRNRLGAWENGESRVGHGHTAVFKYGEPARTLPPAQELCSILHNNLMFPGGRMGGTEKLRSLE